jgi:phage FluMu protein Com
MSVKCPKCKVEASLKSEMVYTDVNGNPAEFSMRCLRCNQVMQEIETEKV